MFQTIFQRYELKYLVTEVQKEKLLQGMKAHMQEDRYGQSIIRNIYFDTDNHRLIRRSIEKPAYKEKLRIRSYAQASDDSIVFVELKKKFDGVVYKRRLPMALRDAMDWIEGGKDCPVDTQIAREIQYFQKVYGEMHPAVFLSYRRQAYHARDGSNFRVTFDDQVLCRRENLSLSAPVYGTPLLKEGMVLMELKCAGGIPLWMAKLLSQERIYKTSFSKYGTAYQQLIFPQKERITNG